MRDEGIERRRIVAPPVARGRFAAAVRAVACRPWLRWTFLASLVAATYGPFLASPFVFDDLHAVATNPYIRGLGNIGEFFADPAASSFHGRYLAYRPVLLTSYALSYAITGPDPWSFRLVNLLLHLLNSMLVFFLLRRLLAVSNGGVSDGGVAALGGVLVFLLHPAQTQAVMYISSRSELLASAFVLAAVLAFLEIQRPTAGKAAGRSPWAWPAAVVAFALALFTKATAALFFPAAILASLAILPRLDWRGAGRIVRLLLPFAVLYLAHHWLKQALTVRAAARIGSAGAAGVAAALPASDGLARLEAFAVYPRLALVPYPLSVFHQLPRAEGAALLLAACSVLLLVAFAVGAAVALRRSRLVAMALVWFPAMLVPYFFVFLNLKVNEHRLYLALVAVAVLVACWLRPWPTRRSAALLSVLLALYVTGTVARNMDWTDRERFWRHEAAQSPDLPWPYERLTNIYDSAGRRREADEAFRQALALGDRNPGFVHSRLARLALKAGRLEEARDELRLALKHDPFAPDDLNDLGSVLDELGDRVEAEKALKRALALTPCFAIAHFNLGLVYQRLGEEAEARAAFRQAVRCDAYYGKAQAKLGAILLDRGENATALRHLTRAAALPPVAPWVFYDIALAQARGGSLEAALHALEQAAAAGFRDLAMAADEPAFRNLQQRPRFRSLLAAARGRAAERTP